MTEVALFGHVRGVGRRSRDPLSRAYACRLPNGLDGSALAVLDPYGLHGPERLVALMELARERGASAIDNINEALLRLLSLANLGIDARVATAEAVLSGPEFGPKIDDGLPSFLDELDAFLVDRTDAPDEDSLRAWMQAAASKGAATTAEEDVTALARALASEPTWVVDRLRIGVAVVATMYARNSAEIAKLRARVTRLCMVASMLETLVLLEPARISSQAIYDLLHRRPLLISPVLMAPLRRASNLARQPGMTDLYVVRSSWARYELGEVAAVEPIMAGEEKVRIFERISETEESSSTTEFTSSRVDRDNQASDRYEMSRLLAQSVQQTASVEGWVNADTEAPPTKVSSHVGADYSYSSQSQSDVANRKASEIVSRVVAKIEESVSTSRNERRLHRLLDRAEHRFDNTSRNTSINGVFRWVDKIELVEVVKYPSRFVFEVQVPEPAAWVRWLFARQVAETNLADPGNFPETQTAEVVSEDPASSSYYLLLGARFGADSLPPPPTSIFVAGQVTGPDQGESETEFGVESEHELAVPDGYVAASWRATCLGTSYDRRDASRRPSMDIAVGAGAVTRVPWSSSGEFVATTQGNIGNLNIGNIPVAIKRLDIQEYVVNLEIKCEPGGARLAQWRMDVWSALRRAHAERRAAFEAAKNRLDVLRATLPETGRSPARNREIVRSELKRLTIEMLTDSQVRGVVGMDYPAANVPPILNRARARESAPTIQFIEQAFEWVNLAYVFYPTYWAPDSRWQALFALEDPDPEFAAFLRSGSARVVVPVRPGYEHQAALFVDYGILWGGGATPGPEDSDYLSVANEIEDLQRGPRDGDVVRQWSIRLPTSMVALDGRGEFPLSNPDVALPVRPVGQQP